MAFLQKSVFLMLLLERNVKNWEFNLISYINLKTFNRVHHSMRQIPGKIITPRLIGGNINLTNLSFHLWGIFKISKKEIDGRPPRRGATPHVQFVRRTRATEPGGRFADQSVHTKMNTKSNQNCNMVNKTNKKRDS